MYEGWRGKVGGGGGGLWRRCGIEMMCKLEVRKVML